MLDKIDLRILYELDCDCRQSLSSIAKKIRKSPAYVKYRIERLKEERTIKTVSIITNIQPDTNENYCFIKLRGSDIIEEKMLLDFIFKMPEAYRLYYCDGEFDIVVSFLIKDAKRLNEIKGILLENFPSIIKLSYHAIANSEIYTKKYLQEITEHEKIEIRKVEKEPDDLSKKVIGELQRNPFTSLLEISTTLNISYDRIKYLFKIEKPYIGSRLILSEKFVKKAILFIDVKKEFNKIKTHCSFHPNVTQIDNLIGESNFAIFFECLPGQEMHRIVKEFLYHFKDSISDKNKVDIINTYKYMAVI